MLDSMEKKNILVNVCTFMCGLVVGGVLVYFINANKVTDVMETTACNESDYPQVYGVDLSF